ncbi:MAG TPA: hypothetical protein VGO45_08590 [Bacteroidia bacterium]|nr:hypothetical protein [Bacteroidia bacterium]
MKSLILFLILTTSALFSNAQTGSINQLDSAGKKNGKWVVYMNAGWQELKDSASAVYGKYTYFVHGTNLYPMGPREKKWKIERTGGSDRKTGAAKLLDGEYKWMDEEGRTRFVDVFKNGDYQSYKRYYTSGKINQVFDYTKNWKGVPHTWCAYEHDKKGNVTYYYMRKGPNGWTLYPCAKADVE